MADKLRKFRKDDYVGKRFGKDINVSTKEDAPLKKDMSAAETKSVAKAKPASGDTKPSSFGAAFAAARKNPEAMKAGKFTWNGKSFSTALASDKKVAPAPVRRAPATETKKAAAPATVSKKVEKPSLAAAFDRTGLKAAPITSTGTPSRLISRDTKGATPAKRPLFGKDGIIAGYDSRETAAKRVEEGKAKAKAGNPLYKSYLDKAKGGVVKKAKGGKIDGIAVRGKTKAGRK